MHRGKSYPYHPAYWSAPAWFWPGFLPWRMVVEVASTNDPPWDQWATYGPTLQLPGVPSDDYGQMVYNFFMNPMYGNYTLKIFLDRAGDHPNYSARWTAKLWQSNILLATAYAFQNYPQTRVGIIAWDRTVPEPPYTSTAGPIITCRPASYEEGGSPWYSRRPYANNQT